MLKCVVIGLALLCCVSGFEVFSTLAKSTTKRDITPAAELCFLNALSGDAAGVSSECVQALATAPDDQARKDATCSPLCDSLYAAVELCLGPEQTRVAYNEICTNGYQGPP